VLDARSQAVGRRASCRLYANDVYWLSVGARVRRLYLDADKSERCYEERGFDFDRAAKIFEGDSLEWEDRRRDYGEPRFVTLGQVDDEILVVVWTPRDNMRRIISARPASRQERESFYGEREAHQQRDS
jgi:uncharacterized DUF497 family protein